MQTEIKMKTRAVSMGNFIYQENEISMVNKSVKNAWQTIAPSWPLKNIIACNPLQGLENQPIEEAIKKGMAYFQQPKIPTEMEAINRETIKWCQAFFDQGQATIDMPYRHLGLYQSWIKLARFDSKLKGNNSNGQIWISELSESPEITIIKCLSKLDISYEQREHFLTLLLTTLPGWAGYIKYRTEWAQHNDSGYYPISQLDYLAMRLVITTILWPEARKLKSWYQQANVTSASSQMQKIIKLEEVYRRSLVKNLYQQTKIIKLNKYQKADAQFIFCIDVRSEPFRRELEKQGNYETFGFAGFFGVPIRIKNEMTNESYSSCPVLLAPEHNVKEKPLCSAETYRKILQGKDRVNTLKNLYQSVKYTFTTPFALVETLGPWSGLWMLLKTIIPTRLMKLRKILLSCIQPTTQTTLSFKENSDDSGISLQDQCQYAENALRMMGLTKFFSPLIFLCGHASSTENNAYATALDCGACGGHHGDGNAKVLATMLNDTQVRQYLVTRDIVIPDETIFVAAKHNTTTDEVILYENESVHSLNEELNAIKKSIEKARMINSKWRCKQMGYIDDKNNNINQVIRRSMDWSQTRPEWGLASNAAFIVAPRDLTKNINLEGRAFLHSYDWQQDDKGSSLTRILTAPMIVAQWINSQYLFSSLDNVAYGGGSKITHNITGKIGIMQGNGSDLMTGLPLQSINISDHLSYHQPMRLLVIVYAPVKIIEKIISEQAVLKKLFGNGWVSLICIDPENTHILYLERNMQWTKHP